MIHFRIIRYVTLVCGFFLAGCAPKNIDQSYAFSQTAGKGVVIGSITYVGASSACTVVYRKIGDTNISYFSAGHSDMLVSLVAGNDIEGGADKGDLFAVEVPAGDYEIVRWAASSGYAHMGSAEDFSIHFHVEPGKAVYLGNFYFEEADRFGATTTGMIMDYRDRAERDMKVFVKKYPGFSNIKIASSIETGRVYKNLGQGSNVSIEIPPIMVITH
ncbi:hypothetical protein F2P47_00095 [Parvibaculum sedimenti]|uniref:Uncharacterized protein n=1 Tax=Parvibaculum sedimenti TaxID=2608632 RepID=A0A6N6VMY2_9HYPH|nr:hypothetical protein [Parvibaculum sedimenti]KAB7742577.1 hypothetical protein F2P47_00095 [Parvibaculum sedimenti]